MSALTLALMLGNGSGNDFEAWWQVSLCLNQATKMYGILYECQCWCWHWCSVWMGPKCGKWTVVLMVLQYDTYLIRQGPGFDSLLKYNIFAHYLNLTHCYISFVIFHPHTFLTMRYFCINKKYFSMGLINIFSQLIQNNYTVAKLIKCPRYGF